MTIPVKCVNHVTNLLNCVTNISTKTGSFGGNNRQTVITLGKSKTIFLVEDDEDDQEFFKAALKDIDNTICLDLAVNGVDAIYKLDHMSILPDLIFMDVNMPLMNGFECLKRLKSMAQFKDIPVIILTTSSNTAESRRAVSLEASSFLTKPSNSSALKRDVEDMLRIYMPSQMTGLV